MNIRNSVINPRQYKSTVSVFFVWLSLLNIIVASAQNWGQREREDVSVSVLKDLSSPPLNSI